ncbi:hypothetical protein CAOG_06911 [Capsaspora owczarzaki ATCC 30864]|uniref:Essential for reactive oxygen species protein n=1 Tax=Capsaspora owczarzaki (strain ATCC 30864) TaxID=595528 RepID=A0A0D2UNU2_CAPO3|nr:hypothetical protein CAOG_06911 [Capsaspora owczarzaki ATCC 30864]KJE96611.1 hypothetical protein CAOG_006911 [Capsaspora owczarzaki ATCC 30864]|eukprot:XP_004344532.1 hypothetical protein CAOG_06911 [Capsaspora owczarzaki ATCC 30864]
MSTAGQLRERRPGNTPATAATAATAAAASSSSSSSVMSPKTVGLGRTEQLARFGTYLNVTSCTATSVTLKHRPSARSWVTLGAFLSFGVLLFMFNPTTLFWRVVQVLFCAFLGVSNMELWEEVIVDKSAGQISMRRYNFIDWTRARYVVQIADVDEVIVGQHALGFGGFSQLCFRAELVLNTGAVVPLTDTYSLGQGKNVDKIVDFLSDFVGLEVDPNEEHTVRKTVRMRLEDDDAAATAAQQSSSDDESDPDEDQEAKYLQQRAADSLNATN